MVFRFGLESGMVLRLGDKNVIGSFESTLLQSPELTDEAQCERIWFRHPAASRIDTVVRATNLVNVMERSQLHERDFICTDLTNSILRLDWVSALHDPTPRSKNGSF